MSKRVLIWGSTQVGKTALLATALFSGAPELRALEGRSQENALYLRLSSAWQDLAQNRYVTQTTTDESLIPFKIDQTEFEFVDVRGGLTSSLAFDPGAREQISNADAVLFLAEYSSPDQQRQMAVIELAVAGMGEKPMALAFTKCELHMRHESQLWYAKEGWLKETPAYKDYSRILDRFEGSAWPTSAFGYALPEKYPAIILGEFGQILPFHIQPRNVALPLAYLLRELDCL